MGPASKPVVGPGNNTFILQPGKHEMKIVDTAPQLEAAFKHSLIIDISDISAKFTYLYTNFAICGAQFVGCGPVHRKVGDLDTIEEGWLVVHMSKKKKLSGWWLPYPSEK